MEATKRPWKVAEDPENNVIGRHVLVGVWAGRDDGVDRPGHIQVAKITYGDKSTEENSANARLIVKAVNLHENVMQIIAECATMLPIDHPLQTKIKGVLNEAMFSMQKEKTVK